MGAAEPGVFTFGESYRSAYPLGPKPPMWPGGPLSSRGGLIIGDKRKRALRRHEERIERKITYFDDASRRQRTRRVDTDRRNPEKYTIAVGGDWEVFAYPYLNPERLFLRIKDAVECFEPGDLSRLFSRVSSRIRRYTVRLGRGVKRRDFSGRLFQSALESGIRRFSEQQSKNELLYIRGVEYLSKCKECVYYVHRLQSAILCGSCRADARTKKWLLGD